jgi:hypothetical protein
MNGINDILILPLNGLVSMFVCFTLANAHACPYIQVMTVIIYLHFFSTNIFSAQSQAYTGKKFVWKLYAPLLEIVRMDF